MLLRNKPVWQLIIFSTLLEAGCSGTPDTSDNTPDAQQRVDVAIDETDSTERLIAILENETVKLSSRGEAASLLGKRRTPKVFDKLISMLPGDENVVTLEIIVALGEHENPMALPVLEKLKYSGKIGAALDEVIKNLRAKQKP